MADISIIQNEKLRELMDKSSKWNALSDEEKNGHLERITKLTNEKQETLCDFFGQENQKEEDPALKSAEAEKLRVLQEFYDKVLALEKKFNNLLKQEPENKSREAEEKELDGLLDQLEGL